MRAFIRLMIASLFCTTAALAVENGPLRLGIIHFYDRLDIEKSLAEADYSGWVPVVGERVIGSINDSWVGFVDLSNMKFLWWYKSDSSLAVPAGIFGDGYAYLGFMSGRIAKVDLATGKQEWQAELSAYPTRALLKVGDVLIAQATDGNVYALNISDGKTKWVSDIGAVGDMVLRVGAAPIILGSQIVLANSDGALMALNLENGKLEWRELAQNKRGRFVGFTGEFQPSTRGFTGSRYDGIVAAWQVNQSQAQWSKNLDVEIMTSTQLDKNILLGTRNSLVILSQDTGAVIKTIPTSHPVSFIVKGPREYILMSEDGDMTSMDEEFKVKWQDRLEADIKSAPFIVGNKLYVSSGLKNIYVYQVR